MNATSSIQTDPWMGNTQATWGSQKDLDRIADDASMSEQEKVAELAKEFEAMLVKQVLKGMQKTAGGSGLFPTKGPASIYGDMMMNSLSQSISDSRQLGFARLFENQLTNKDAIRQEPSAPSDPATVKSKEVK